MVDGSTTYNLLSGKDVMREGVRRFRESTFVVNTRVMGICRGYPKVLNCEVVKLRTRLGETIIGAYFPRKSRTVGYRVPTILFSHGNAVDLGILLGFFRYDSSNCQ